MERKKRGNVVHRNHKKRGTATRGFCGVARKGKAERRLDGCRRKIFMKKKKILADQRKKVLPSNKKKKPERHPRRKTAENATESTPATVV